MAKSEETKPAKCPYCGVKPKVWGVIGGGSVCDTNGCRLQGLRLNDPEWNALCADIERGKLAVEAVRLLDRFETSWHRADQQWDDEQAVSEFATVVNKVREFVDLPAVAEIIAAQKDGGS